MSDELQKQLAVLKDNYLTSLPSKIDDIRKTWASAFASRDDGRSVELHRKAHSLAGSGSTFDQNELSSVSKQLESFVKEHMDAGDLFSEKNSDEIGLLIKEMENSYAGNKSKNNFSNMQTRVELEALGLKVDKMKILIADDDIDNRNRMELIVKSSGHEVYLAADGKEAVELSLLHRPDIILMDVIMPVMTGYDAARQIKKALSDKFVPILFLTAVTDNESLAGCISSGGDDFINKPVHPLILNAKLAAFQRITHMYEKLDEYQRKNEEEMQASKEVLESVIYGNEHKINGLNIWAKSPGHFSGDTHMCRQMDNGHIYVLLCDFTGHGLPAAIGTVFVADLFRTMTSNNAPAIDVLSEINTKMNQILPTGRYCAAIMMDYFPSKKEVLLWNCGLPDVYLVDEHRKIVANYASHNVPLGVLPGAINSEPYKISVADIRKIVFFSDGITEAEDPSGNMYGEEKLVNLIENTVKDNDLFTVIKKDVEIFLDGKKPTDDISLVVFKF
ncbi:MAG: fused response regulator/phosphatase [Gammaproteobacteria bacterium]|nr:fused response regulator/phosphatase [Gammaproteobacteria bacterium]